MVESRKFTETLAWARKEEGKARSWKCPCEKSFTPTFIEFYIRLVEGYNRIKGSFSSNKEMVVDVYQGLTDEPVLPSSNLYPNPYTRFISMLIDTTDHSIYGNLFDIPVCGKYAQVKVSFADPIEIDDWFNIWVGVY